MLLYRYFGTHAEETIESGLMKVAKPSELNDPFEFMYEATGKASLKAAADLLKVTMASPIARVSLAESLGARSNAELNKIIRENRPKLLRGLKETHDKRATELISGVLERADRQWRLISFTGETTDASEILMWSHYAAKHSGVRIAFEIPLTADGFIIEKVQYQAHRVAFDTTDFNEEKRNKSAFDAMRTKCNIWAYENEFRLLAIPEPCRKIRGIEFLNFEYSWVKKVYLGARYPKNDQREKFLSTLRSRCPNAEVYDASVARSGFALAYNRIG